METQREITFFNPTGYNDLNLPPRPTDDEIRSKLNNCALDRFITNSSNLGPLRKLKRFVFSAMTRYNRDASDFSFALLGGPSTGKTFLAKLFHETIDEDFGYPFVMIQPKAVKNTQDIFDAMVRECRQCKIPLRADEQGDYEAPPMIIFIDEVHSLNKGLMEGGLLNATEPNDGWLVTPENIRCDCGSVCWIVATTDAGKLFDAFHSRFHKIELAPAGKAEVAQIVHDVHKELPLEVCHKIAKYCRLPRDAKRFALELLAEMRLVGNKIPVRDSIIAVANGNGLDEFGMHWKQLEIIKALGSRGPISKNKLCSIAKCKVEELEKFILPSLEEFYEDRGALIVTTTRGYSITEEGIKELAKRNLPYNEEVLEAA